MNRSSPVTIDPAELWERYLDEIRADRGEPSPQGAMAFAVDALRATQPAAPAGEPAAWMRIWPDGDKTFSKQKPQELAGHKLTPLYATPSAPAQSDELEQLRIERDALRGEVSDVCEIANATRAQLEASRSSAASAEATIEEAMWMLQDVPGETLVERIARITKWYQDLCSHDLAQRKRNPDATEMRDLRQSVIELRDWKAAVLGCCKVCDGFEAMHWGGDKDGWGFVMYFISHLNTRVLDAEKTLALSSTERASG